MKVSQHFSEFLDALRPFFVVDLVIELVNAGVGANIPHFIRRSL
ncbi:MAG: hypothetical protein RAP03_10080 [Candidatus Electryonea clarkiae]|nr:hypothetical protein [Candidatus Electryonea clarkiae]